MNPQHRAHIRLQTQADALAFVQQLSLLEDVFFLESDTGSHRVNAKSLLSVLYTLFDFPDELYLVNATHSGKIPAFVDRFRVAV